MRRRHWWIGRIARSLTVGAVALGALGAGAPPAGAHNGWAGAYRKWPWSAGVKNDVTTLPGEGVHATETNQLAIDIGNMDYEKVHATSPAVGFAKGFGNCQGAYLVMEDADGTFITYEHLDSFLVAAAPVVAGQPIAVSGGSGSCSTGPHLHFQRSVKAPEWRSTDREHQLPLTPISGHGVGEDQLCHCPYQSDNAGIGFSEASRAGWFTVAYNAHGGYEGLGVTANVGDAWSPCRKDAIPGTWYRYTCAPREGVYGSVQTFVLGTRQRAIVQQAGVAAAFVMHRGILGAYTQTTGWMKQDWIYYLGYPTADRAPLDETRTLWRQDFEEGHIYFDSITCREDIWYRGVWKVAWAFCD